MINNAESFPNINELILLLEKNGGVLDLKLW